jgi:hypothetical protein
MMARKDSARTLPVTLDVEVLAAQPRPRQLGIILRH